MIRLLAFLSIILLSTVCRGQNYADSIAHGISLANEVSYEDAYDYLVALERKIPDQDTNRLIAVEIIIDLATAIEKYYRGEEQYLESLAYAEAIQQTLGREGEHFPPDYLQRIPLSIKNQLVAHFGLENYRAADSLRRELYALQAAGELPKGLDEFFNYDFFKVDSLNVWGYEWFEELPEDRYSSSFTKVVYYVYSTDENGADKDQLYLLHVLMYHGNSDKFDYVLTKRLDKAENEPAGTLWCYTYSEDIDYQKLKQDVIRVIGGAYNPCLEKKD